MVLIALSAGIYAFFVAAVRPHQEAEKQAIKTAKEYVDFASVTDFQQYNGKEVFYTVFGKNDAGEQLMVAISKKHQGQVYIYKDDQGISARQAEAVAKKEGAHKVEQITFGIVNGSAIWEVHADSAYYLIDFETGQFIKKEGL
ncbi:cell wall elongation regulator TseB-like domain-containing protein [Streptococcus dentapri]|uniref:cell wall elongation regulator TseB-like domain-containing protein n=1 Tax=Streptococcus dentapri TaxID=573564 RepID=UPI0036D38CC2